MLQLLSYVAQTEREFIRQRQAEGIAAAKAKGIRFGRPPMELPAEFDGVYHAWARGELSARSAAKRLRVSHQTFLKWSRNCVSNGTRTFSATKKASAAAINEANNKKDLKHNVSSPFLVRVRRFELPAS